MKIKYDFKQNIIEIIFKDHKIFKIQNKNIEDFEF